MINREMRQVEVISFTPGTDAYGQIRQQGQSKREVEMLVKIYQQTNTNDVRYVDIDLIGLTKDKSITDKNQIEIDGNNFQVKYIIPSGRYTQVFLKRV